MDRQQSRSNSPPASSTNTREHTYPSPTSCTSLYFSFHMPSPSRCEIAKDVKNCRASSFSGTSDSSMHSSSSAQSSSSDSALKSERKSWLRRLSGGLLDTGASAGNKAGDLNKFLRELKTYQLSKDQLGTLPSVKRLREDGRADLAQQLEALGGQITLAKKLGMRIRVEASLRQ